MSELRVAGRYAKSLIDLSKEQKSTDAIKADMLHFQETVSKNVSLYTLLNSPIVKNGDKLAVLNKVFAGACQKLTMDFLAIVVRKNRSNILPSIAVSYLDQYNELNNIVKATVKSSHPIDAKTTVEVTQFVEKQTGKKVLLTTTVDPTLIGGLVIQVGDSLYDASISGKLNKVKQNLLNTYISK